MKETKKILKNNKGQGVMEYVILTGLIGIFCLGAVKSFGGKIQERITQMENRIDKKLKIAR